MRLLRDIRDERSACLLRETREVIAMLCSCTVRECDPPLRRRELSRKEEEQRRFSTAAVTCNHGGLSCGKGECEIRQNGLVGQRIAVGERLRAYGGRGENLIVRSRDGRRCIEVGGKRFLCRRGIHRRMEGNAALTQRLIELWCKDEHEERRLKGHAAVHETQTDGDRDEGNRQGCNQFQCKGGDKGKPQYRERGLGERMAHLGKMMSLRIDAAKDFKRRRRTHQISESVRQRTHLIPLTLAGTARRLADEVEEKWRDRQGDQKEQCRQRIDDSRHEQDDRDDDDTCDHGGQESAKPRVERIDALKRHRQYTRTALPLCQHLSVEGTPAEEAQIIGELRLDAALWQAQESHGENAQKQHQKL